MNLIESEGFHPVFGECIGIPGLDIYQPLDIQVQTYKENFNQNKYGDALKAGKQRLIADFQIVKCLKKTFPIEMHSAYDTKQKEGVSLVQYKTAGVPNVGDLIRETGILRSLNNKNILEFYGTVYSNNIGRIYLSFEPFECFLSQLLHKGHCEIFETSVVKCTMQQLLNGLEYLHEKKIVHRDITPKNIVITESGILKISNFRRAQRVGKCKKEVLSADFCYQPVEVLMGIEKTYTAIDIWSATCIFAEMLLKEKLFKSLLCTGVIQEIFETLGLPDKSIWPEFAELSHCKGLVVDNFHKWNFLGEYFPDEIVLQLLRKGFIYNVQHRISADEILQDRYFVEEPKACSTKYFGMKLHNKKFHQVKFLLPISG